MDTYMILILPKCPIQLSCMQLYHTRPVLNPCQSKNEHHKEAPIITTVCVTTIYACYMSHF